MAELQRKEEAAKAAAAVEASEKESVQMLLYNLSVTGDNATTGILGNVTMPTESGTLQVTAVAPEALQRQRGVEVSLGEVATLRVPRAVLVLALAAQGDPGQAEGTNASGIVLITFMVDKKQKAEKVMDAKNDGEPRSEVAAQTLSINLRRDDGSVVPVHRLPEPIEFVLRTNDDNASCAFWDEEQSAWSAKGLQTVSRDTPGQITCRTIHLSIFSAALNTVWQNIASAVLCSSAWDMLTPEGFERVLDSHWMTSPPALAAFVFMLFFSIVLLIAAYMDRRTRRAIPWEMVEPVLFRTRSELPEDGSEAEDVGESRQTPGSCCLRQLAELKDWCFWCAGICFGVENILQIITEVLPNAPEAVVNRCIKTLHAHRSGVAKDSLAILLQPGEKFDADDDDTEDSIPKQVSRSQNRQSLFAGLASVAVPEMNNFTSAIRDLNAQWNVHIHGATAVKAILVRSWCVRVFVLFPAFHPWIALLRLSILTSYKVRVSLIYLKICAAAFANGLFFTSSALPSGSDPACAPKEILARLIRNLTVGLISAFLGDCAVFTLFLLQVRKPMVKKEWTERSMARQIAI